MTTIQTARPTTTLNIPIATDTNSQRPKSPPSPIRSRATPPRVQTPTAMLINNSTPKQCYLCDEQNPGDFSPTTKFLESCLLCSRDFCPVHKADSKFDTPVCNINHSTYYHSCMEEARKYLADQSNDTNLPVRDTEVEELVMQDGVFPSIGEREKSVFMRSPVSDDQKRLIEEVRSRGAETSGNKGRPSSTLIETVSFIGADVAA